MYTLDGLWHNVWFYDVFFIVAGVVCMVIGIVGWKKSYEEKILFAAGVLSILLFSWKLVGDIRSIQAENFIKTQGVFEYAHRASKRGLTYEYVFSTDAPKKQCYYLDVFTSKEHLGEDFEFCAGATYEIIYDEATKIIVGIRCIDGPLNSQ